MCECIQARSRNIFVYSLNWYTICDNSGNVRIYKNIGSVCDFILIVHAITFFYRVFHFRFRVVRFNCISDTPVVSSRYSCFYQTELRSQCLSVGIEWKRVYFEIWTNFERFCSGNCTVSSITFGFFFHLSEHSTIILNSNWEVNKCEWWIKFFLAYWTLFSLLFKFIGVKNDESTLISGLNIEKNVILSSMSFVLIGGSGQISSVLFQWKYYFLRARSNFSCEVILVDSINQHNKKKWDVSETRMILIASYFRRSLKSV